MPLQNNRQSKSVLAVAMASLLIRLGFSFFADFSDDPSRIYAQGLDFFLHGTLSVTGASVVYTGTALPGSLQSVLAGLPLFVSAGLPWGLGVFVALLNFIAAVLIYRIFRRLLPKISALDLALFIFLAPWTILFTSVWNPSFLPIFSALFFWGLLQHFEKPRSFAAAFCMGLSMVCALQLHLSFVLLPLTWLGVTALRWVKLPDWKGFLSGIALAGVGLLPFFLKPSAAQEHKQDFLLKNLEFHWDHFKQWPAFFLRFLSFATGETTHFIGMHRGLAGALDFLGAHPFWIVPGFLVLCTSIALVWQGIKFYLNPRHWRALKSKPKTALDFFRNISLILPVITGFLFSFSSQGPSAHTFWILMPLCFFPILYTLEKRGFFTGQWCGFKYGAFWKFYCILAVTFCVGTYFEVDHPTLLGAQSYATDFADHTLSWDKIPERDRPYVKEVLRALPSPK